MPRPYGVRQTRTSASGGRGVEVRALTAIVMGAALLGAACGGAPSGGASGGDQAAPGAVVATTISDNSIVLDQASVTAGPVVFKVKNAGTVVHSMVVIKTNVDEARLPPDAKDPSKVGDLGRVGATGQMEKGVSKDLTLDLTPGKYVLACIESAHYLGGLHVALTVK